MAVLGLGEGHLPSIDIVQVVNDKVDQFLKRHGAIWKSRKESLNPTRILFATNIAGNSDAAALDRFLAIGSLLRGNRAGFVLCNANLDACQIVKYHNAEPSIFLQSLGTPKCDRCQPHIYSRFRALELPISFLNLGVSPGMLRSINRLQDISQVREFRYKDIPVGIHAYAGSIRYFASTLMSREPLALEIAKRYLRSAVQVTESMLEATARFRPDVVVAHHGIYVPQGPVVEVAKRMNIRVLTWTPSYRRGTFIFSPADSYHHTLVSEDIGSWRDMALSADDEIQLQTYMESRESGEHDWITFSDSRPSEHKRASRSLKSGFVLVLTSVSWDAEVHYASRAFPSMRDWLAATIEYAKTRPETEIVIRVHPAELTSPNRSREPMVQFLESLKVAQLSNVQIVGPESPVSTYDLIRGASGIAIFNTKTGIEAAFRGKAVCVAGEAWIRGKGFTVDVGSTEDYPRCLDTVHQNPYLSDAEHSLAKRYAFHFFFRRMIRLDAFSGTLDTQDKRELEIEDLDGTNDVNLFAVLEAIETGVTPVSRIY